MEMSLLATNVVNYEPETQWVHDLRVCLTVTVITVVAVWGISYGKESAVLAPGEHSQSVMRSEQIGFHARSTREPTP